MLDDRDDDDRTLPGQTTIGGTLERWKKYDCVQPRDGVMMAVSRRRAFHCDAKTWTVTRCASSQSRHEIGLRFVHVAEERFLVFSRGLLPSERDLQVLGEEVLRVFLDRAAVR